MKKPHGNKGKKLSAEARLKMSISRKGRVPWNKGIPWSEESKNKMSISHKNNLDAIEKLRNMSKANRGIRMSPETEFKKGVRVSIETEFKKGINNIHWKEGRRKCNGYICILSPEHPFKNKNETVHEHRLVVEKHINRYLAKNEVVHHINGIKTDNRVQNLMVFTSNSAHSRYHTDQTNVKLNEIVFDGRNIHHDLCD